MTFIQILYIFAMVREILKVALRYTYIYTFQEAAHESKTI